MSFFVFNLTYYIQVNLSICILLRPIGPVEKYFQYEFTKFGLFHIGIISDFIIIKSVTKAIP